MCSMLTARSSSATFLPTAQDVIERVAAEHWVDSDTYRVTAHMAIAGA